MTLLSDRSSSACAHNIAHAHVQEGTAAGRLRSKLDSRRVM